jgi:hypothetical protein
MGEKTAKPPRPPKKRIPKNLGALGGLAVGFFGG